MPENQPEHLPADLAARWSLRARLVLMLLVLGIAALGTFGVASVLLIRQSQMARVDTQLAEFGGGLTRFVAPGRPATVDTSEGLPTEFLLSIFAPDGSLRSTRGRGVTESAGPELPRVDAASYPTQAAAPFTVPDQAGGAGWRVRVFQSSQGIAAVAVSLAGTEAVLGQLVGIEVAVGVIVLVVLVAVASSVVQLGLRPLTRMAHTAEAIAGGDLDRRVSDMDERTETGRLGGALNTMLGTISSALRARGRSEYRLRQFVSDASHELRTPLTSIRGFAELYRRGGAPERADVDRMMARIEVESARMGELVDDLLLLARLDEQRPLDLAEVDLVVLAGDAVHDATQSARRDTVDGAAPRAINLHAPDGPVRVLGDERRLRQVLANLLGNAVTHTAAGTPVTVSVRSASTAAEPDEPVAAAGPCPPDDLPVAVLEVSDAGDGVAGDEAPRVFDRFYRADAARSRAAGGSGLGLAIVAAIVEAHGGRVELRDAPGGGARFRTVLAPLNSAVTPADGATPRRTGTVLGS